MDTIAILTGVVAGVVASFLIQTFSAIIKKIIIPWYQKMIYHGVDISGEWEGEHITPSGTKVKEIFTIEQNASYLRATIVKSKIRKSGKEEIARLKFNGTIHDRIIALIGKDINPNKIGKNTLLLELIKGGEEMSGVSSWYSITQSEVQSQEIAFKRK